MNQRISELTFSARDNAERGAVMFLVALTALIVMVAGAIAVDLSAVATRGQSLQNAADSAALAGVQAYRQSMGERTEATAEDETAAIDAVTNLLAQNGITDITPNIEFPDEANDTEVKVTLFDDDAGFLLSGFTGGSAGTVERSATARFEACDATCIREVAIPPPFNGVDAAGDGDGYKPIPVGNALYSINHQSGAFRGNLQITCVLRGLRHRTDRAPSDDVDDKTQLCWDDSSGAPVPGKTAYPSNYVSGIRSTPEMPHAAVVDTRIYWATSSSSAHYMFCFETTTATPCSQPLQLTSDGDGYQDGPGQGLSYRESHRGGGTVAVDGLIYSFTDDHRVHCVVPTVPMQSCGGYPKDTSLGHIGFPDNETNDGNHGSSIDRIVHPESGDIYSTLHIANVPAGSVPPCSFTGDTMTASIGGLNDNEVVTLKNANSGLFISMNTSHNGLVDGVDAEDPNSQWVIDRYSNQNNYRFQNVGAMNAGRTRYLAISDGGLGSEMTYTTAPSYNRVFVIEPDLTTVAIRGYNRPSHYIREGSINGSIEFVHDTYQVLNADWVIKPWECEVPDAGATLYGGVAYESGTYLNCHTPGSGTCSGFTPLRIHADGGSFSGRLFFHRNGAGDPTGVCSTGFSVPMGYQAIDYGPTTEITCVTVDGAAADYLETDMAAFRNTLALSNSGASVPDYDGIGSVSNGRWGTWGDPHYNEEQNRLFYPTHRIASQVICWDFDSGSCGENVEQVSAVAQTQDYGFFSEGNCVFGLGHTANFYAFQADNPTERCDTSSTETWLTPCNCGGEQFWGSLEFDVTESQFEEFFIEIRDEAGLRVYPPSALSGEDETPPHNLLTQGSTINLTDYPVVGENPQLQVLVTVKSYPGIDPWADGEGSQTFTVEIARTPRLTD